MPQISRLSPDSRLGSGNRSSSENRSALDLQRLWEKPLRSAHAHERIQCVLIVQAGFIGPLEKETHDLILVILTLEYIVVDMSNMCRPIWRPSVHRSHYTTRGCSAILGPVRITQHVFEISIGILTAAEKIPGLCSSSCGAQRNKILTTETDPPCVDCTLGV